MKQIFNPLLSTKEEDKMDRKKVIMIILSGVATVLLMIVLAGQFLSHNDTENQKKIVSEMPSTKGIDQSFSGSGYTGSMTNRASAEHTADQPGTISGYNETGNLQKEAEAAINSGSLNSTTMPADAQNTRSTRNRKISGYAGSSSTSPIPGAHYDSSAGTSEDSIRHVGGTGSGDNNSSVGTGELFEGEEKVILPSEELKEDDDKNTGSDSKASESKLIDTSDSDFTGADAGINSSSNSNPGKEKQANILSEDDGENKYSEKNTYESDNKETNPDNPSLQNGGNNDQNLRPENDRGKQTTEGGDTTPQNGIELPVLLF